jgi:N-carbamoylputrescine amidase
MLSKIKAAAAQFEHAEGDITANLTKVRTLAESAAEDGTQILICPECCLTGYWFLNKLPRERIAELAQRVPHGPAVQELMAIAHDTGVIVGAGLIEACDGEKFYNTYVVAQPDGTTTKHRKLHTFVNEHMSSGNNFTVFEALGGWKFGILTCYDNNLIENVRVTALMGADVIIAPHQTGGCRTHDSNIMGVIDQQLWHNRTENPDIIEAEFKSDKGRGWLLRWLPSRAHDNGVFYLFSNGVGIDGDEVRTGNAMIIDTFGRTLAETSVAADATVTATLDPKLLDEPTGRRWITARRPELYAPLTTPTGKEVDIFTARFAGKGG